MANRIQLRRDTTANWANVNPILSDGEMGYDINTNEIRIGDGSTEWTGLSGNTIGGGGGAANIGDVTFNGINIIGDDNLRFQPNTTVTDGYVDIYLTTGPDIHIDHSGGNLILGPDNWANVRLATEGNVQIRAQDGTSISTWTFNPDGNVILPLGSTIGETATTTVISPPGAAAGQSLVIRPTSQFTLSASGNIVAGANLTITLTNTASPTATQFNYTITGATTEQLGIGSLTGSFPVLSPPDEVPQSSSIVLPIPAESNATTVTLTIDSDQPEGAANVTITVTGNAVISSESSHIHLLSGNVATVDLYLGDDDQYVKIEKNAGNVVIGTIANSSPSVWRFGTDGNLTIPGNLLGSFAVSPAPSISGFDNANFAGNVTVGNLLIASGGEIKAEAGTGNVVIEANDGTLRTYTFGSDGTLTLPRGGGTGGSDEGAEIVFTTATNSSLSGNAVVVDQYVNKFRFFEAGGNTRGAYIDLAQAADGVGTLLNNRVSGFVNAGANVIMDNIKATVTSSSNRGLSLATVSGTETCYISGTYGMNGGPGTSGNSAGFSMTTTPSASFFSWNFTSEGDAATYILNYGYTKSYRITMMIGAAYNNNMISIERLV